MKPPCNLATPHTFRPRGLPVPPPGCVLLDPPAGGQKQGGEVVWDRWRQEWAATPVSTPFQEGLVYARMVT